LGLACVPPVLRQADGRTKTLTNSSFQSEVRPQPPHCDKNSYTFFDHLLSSVEANIQKQ
jgi:hypothetical protein